MATRDEPSPLTASLEDYLETIYELVRDKKFARVRDIARARGVKPSSVSLAMKRLAELGLVTYVQREYIDLTPEGEEAARRIYSRHRILASFFEEVLMMPAAAAQEEACAMEHSISDEAMDRLVRFFEFMRACPDAPPDFLVRFHECSLVHDDVPECERDCPARRHRERDEGGRLRRLDELLPGQRGRVLQVEPHGEPRQQLLDIGILPDVVVEVVRADPGSASLRIDSQGFQVELSREQARAVWIADMD